MMQLLVVNLEQVPFAFQVPSWLLLLGQQANMSLNTRLQSGRSLVSVLTSRDEKPDPVSMQEVKKGY